ncbi:hypothetical protein DM02DRAFT_636323 [Periconia macrospinosa]|uniref:Uncharacterized protein n=1 Tax=Periconia macrospinosa TaxID=97972 RepID=A0A2V1D0J1_9PLEO|nr:hypothetical protein DM02DRAFT_636323 [Periconia macrospinosa]
MKFTAALFVLGAAMATATTGPTEHVAGLNQSDVHANACAKNPYGCDKGYCWKKCGSTDGPWCWQAWDYGNGAQVGNWVTCSQASDCLPAKLQGADCATCNSGSCGCSC